MVSITHTNVKAPGNKLFAVADWNAIHTIAGLTGGNPTEVIVNIAGDLDGDPNLTWDGAKLVTPLKMTAHDFDLTLGGDFTFKSTDGSDVGRMFTTSLLGHSAKKIEFHAIGANKNMFFLLSPTGTGSGVLSIMGTDWGADQTNYEELRLMAGFSGWGLGVESNVIASLEQGASTLRPLEMGMFSGAFRKIITLNIDNTISFNDRSIVSDLVLRGGHNFIFEDAPGNDLINMYTPTNLGDGSYNFRLHPLQSNKHFNLQFIPSGSGVAGIWVFGTDYIADSTNWEALVIYAGMTFGSPPVANDHYILSREAGSGVYRDIHIGKYTDMSILNIDVGNGRVGINILAPAVDFDVLGTTQSTAFTDGVAMLTGGIADVTQLTTTTALANLINFSFIVAGSSNFVFNATINVPASPGVTAGYMEVVTGGGVPAFIPYEI